MSTYLKLVITAIISFSLTACGWHLRGLEPIPQDLQSLYLQSNASKDLSRNLRRALKTMGIDLVESRSQANYALAISDLRQERRTISTSSRGKAAEYELTSLLSYEVRDKAGNSLLGPDTLSTSKVYLFDPDNAVGAENEERLLRQEMLRDLMQQLVRRYQALEPAGAE